jgi:Family of unknown function (DUF5947)
VTLDALRRTIRRPPPAEDAPQRCQLCDAPIPDGHRHMLDEQDGNVLCVCHPCELLFERAAAGRGHYRLIPDRRVRLPALDTAALGVPVGLAFFVCRPDGTVVAHYPSPLGVTQWEVDSAPWQAIRAECPEIRQLAVAVEALLVNTTRDADEHWIVPIDDCYRLVAVIRREWRGLSGGSRVWPAIDGFFQGLNEKHYDRRGFA